MFSGLFVFKYSRRLRLTFLGNTSKVSRLVMKKE